MSRPLASSRLTAAALFFLMVLGPLGVSAADAGTLSSSALNPAGTEQLFRCMIVNLGKKPATVTFSIIGFTSGNPVAGPTERTIDPGEGGSLTARSSEFTYCKVERVSKKNARGSFTLEEDLGGNNFVTTLSVPLQ